MPAAVTVSALMVLCLECAAIALHRAVEVPLGDLPSQARPTSFAADRFGCRTARSHPVTKPVSANAPLSLYHASDERHHNRPSTPG